MQRTFTPEILVRHLYNETSHVEASAIRRALAEDASLQQEFNQMQEARAALDDAGGEEPDSTSVQKILAYMSKQTRSVVR